MLLIGSIRLWNYFEKFGKLILKNVPISRASSNQFSLEEDHIMRVKIKAEELRHSNIGAAIVKWYITSLKLCMSEDV